MSVAGDRARTPGGGGEARAGAVDLARALAIAVPPLGLAAWWAYRGEVPASPWGLVAIALGASALAAAWLRGGLSRRLRTVSSVLAAFREGDFSVRARRSRAGGALDGVLHELNGLGDKLRAHRLGEIEAWALLRKVLSEIDVVVLAFDEAGRIKLANDAAARVLGATASSLAGRAAADAGLEALRAGTAPRVVRDAAALGPGPWELRRGAFRLSGEPHSLVVLSDLSGALRDQERDAYKRLIRVMGHEINNSLAPIQSIAENLLGALARSPRSDGWEEDAASGLSVVARRSAALSRFMTAYGRLARLPPPQPRPVDVATWVRRAASLEQRVRVEVAEGPEASVLGDSDQLDQLLINLVKNGADAALETGGGVCVRWSADARRLRVVVEDDGPGVAETANLFVPFFTTKPEGSGIGLVLARQIAEAHGGQVSLGARDGARGAAAEIWLPMGAHPLAPRPSSL